MTERIFYSDAYAQKIHARVLDYRRKDKACWLLLDQTIFFPGGGGQLRDRGTINGKTLQEIREKDGLIWHKIEADPKVDWHNSDVILELDWAYRHYQMQQHSGQHLLSSVLHRHGYPTVSVHLGEHHTLIELDGTIPESALLKQVENEVQKHIAEGVAVNVHYMTREEAQHKGLRRPPKDLNTLRVVEIEGIDVSACGGLHVHNTAEIGMIKILGSERIRGHVRIKAVIGRRAFDYFEELHQITLLLREKLNTDHLQFNSRIAQMQEEISYLKKLAKFYDRHFIAFESARLAEATADVLVAFRLDYGEPHDAAEIAKALSKNFGKVAFLQFDRRFYLSAPNAQVMDTIKFLKENAEALEIRAGGPQGFCQGIMNKNNFEEIVETIRSYIRQKQ